MTYEVKSLNEECGIFGIWGHPQAAQVTYFGLHSLQHRGQEGAGILSNDHGKLKRHRDLGLVAEVFKNPADLDNLTGEAAIGHVRYATSGGNASTVTSAKNTILYAVIGLVIAIFAYAIINFVMNNVAAKN